MDQKNQGVPSGTVKPRVRLPRPPSFDKLKAERIEQPLDAAQVAEKVGNLPGWGVSPKGLSLARRFYFPGEEEARAYSDYLLSAGIGQKVRVSVTVEGSRVYVKLKGKRGGIPPYLLDFAAMLSQ